MRPVMEAAYNDLARGRIPVIVAPTGYGKTRASPEIYERAREDGIAGGLIHVVPLRSLVRRIYYEAFRDHGGAYQMHDPEPGPDKSPYLLRRLVVTTLDSYVLNMYRLPVVESLKIERGLSYGHYYPVYTSVLSGVTVFDEAHLYLSEDQSNRGVVVETLRALVEFLARSGASLVIETATMKPSTLANITLAIRASGRIPVIRTLHCPNGNPLADSLGEALRGRGRLEPVARVEPVGDEDWLSTSQGLKWETRIYKDGWSGAIKDARSLANDGRVLIVANTVSAAVRLADEVGEEAVLIHGRLAAKDRAAAEEIIGRRREARVIVSTQVIEAGVDVNAIAVFTEAAPIENIVQRAGRACRRGEALEWCMENKGVIGVVDTGQQGSVYDPREVRASLEAIASRINSRGGKAVDWRNPCRSNSGVSSYVELIVEVDAAIQDTRAPPQSKTIYSLLLYYLVNDGVPDFLESLRSMGGWCGLVRDAIMTPILVEGDYVLASLQWALTHAEKILEFDEASQAPLLVGIPLAGSGGPVEGPARRAWEHYQRRRNTKQGLKDTSCYQLLRKLYQDMEEIAWNAGAGVTLYRWALKARKGVYHRGRGFTVDLRVKDNGE